MEKCWGDFWKNKLGPQQVYEDSLHPEMCCVGTENEHHCSMFACHHPWDDRCKTKAQEMWQWEDWVLRHYKAPARGGALAAELAGILLAVIMVCR